MALNGKPEIINTDQGSQLTSELFTQFALSRDIKLSMDGKGRAIDHIFIERLWRSVKYESIYLNPPDSGIDLYQQLKNNFEYYNTKKRHNKSKMKYLFKGISMNNKKQLNENKPGLNLS